MNSWNGSINNHIHEDTLITKEKFSARTYVFIKNQILGSCVPVALIIGYSWNRILMNLITLSFLFYGIITYF